ncbi:MAG TPA: hypothetical protein VER37_00630, partial [Thermomicrobiales bacterium]|nr:hypothetical protein [Thermomicrobiales bacterium]
GAVVWALAAVAIEHASGTPATAAAAGALILLLVGVAAFVRLPDNPGWSVGGRTAEPRAI